MKKIKNKSIDLEDSKLRNLLIQLKRSYTIAKKDIRIYYNKPPVLVQGLIFPVILFIAFTIGRNIITLYLISGLIAMVLFLTSTSIGPFVFPWETMRKTFERLITCPVSLKAILLGSMLGSFIFGLIFSFIPLILGFLFFSITLSLIGLLIIISAMIVAAFVFSSFSLILSSPPTDLPGNIMVFTLLLKFTILFISPLFMPIQNHPLAIISPLTYLVDLINIGLGLESAFGPFGIMIDFSILIIFGFSFMIIAFILHEKTLQKRFR